MGDQLDLYLGRCLKNWAMSVSLPVRGRERLIEAAALLIRQAEFDAWRVVTRKLMRDGSPSERHGGWETLGPLTQSRAWLLHQATTWRLATL